MWYDKLASGSEHRKHIVVLAVVVVVLSAVVLFTQLDITGSATAPLHNIEIIQVALTHTATDDAMEDATLTVAADITNKLTVSDTFSVYLHVDGVQKDVRTDQVFYPEVTQTVELDWLLSEGVHTIKVLAADKEFETVIKVTLVDGEYTVTELSVGTMGIPVEHKLDFSEGGVKYDIDVRANDILEITYSRQVYLIDIASITADFVELDGKQISIGADAVFDLNENGDNDVSVRVNSIDASMGGAGGPVDGPVDGVASLTVKSLHGASIWSVLLSFWWLALIIIVLLIAVVLMYRYEKQRVKQHKHLLNRVEDYHKSGVLSKSLYERARRTLKKKLKP